MSTITSDVPGAGPAEAGAAQALLNFAVSHSPVVFYVAEAWGEHKVRFISANVAAISGHAPDLFVNNPSFGRSLLHPEDTKQFDEALEQLGEAGRASREYRMRSADGNYLWYRDELRLANDGRRFVGSMVDVTAEKQAQDRLHEAEALNAAIIGTVQNAIVAADSEGRIMDFNAAAERIFGYTKEQAMGQPLADLIVPETHREAHRAGILRFAETGQTRMVGRRVETEAMRSDGSVFPVELHITATQLEGQTVFVGEIRDISERVAAEKERRRLTRVMQDAIESLPGGFAVTDPGGKMILCNSAFAEVYHKPRESMLDVSRRDHVRAISRELRRFDDKPVTGSERDIERILERLNDLEKGPVEMELKDGRWMLVSHASTTDGGLVAVRTDITRQKRAEKALRESEEYFRRIVEHHPLPVFLFNVEDGQVLYESPAVAALLRRERSAGASYSALEYFPDVEQRKRFVRSLRREGEVRGFEASVRLHDGAAGWVSVTARMLRYKGRDTVIASLVDLTERKAAEEALAASEARYRALVENAPVCIHEIDRDGRIASINPRGLQMAGFPKFGPVVGGRYIDLVHPDDQPLAAERLATAMAGERVELEFRGFAGKGHYFSTKIPLRNEKGEVEKLIGVVIDITERKQQELELKQARETLEDAIESLPDGFALWDSEIRLVMCNARFREYNHLTADILQPGVKWRDFMRTAAQRGQYQGVPEDIDGWISQLWRELDEEGRTREFRDLDGRWFRATARRTRQGGLVGARVDITRYKQMEDVLRDSEALVRQVLEACPVPVLMTRLNSEILYESPAGRALFGRRAREGVQLTLPAWAEADDRDAYIDEVRRNGGVDEYEARLRRSDGSVFPGAISARLIRFKGEEVIVSSTRDLTESRAVQAEMQRQREALYQSEKLSAMGQLLASVAHELNNPLSVVVGQSLMLQETAAESHVTERAAKIGNAADRCARIVKTFLAMARQQPVEMATVDLNAVVETALEVTGYALRSHDIEVALRLAPELPPVWADADQLNQVLTNLLVNAQQALEEQPEPRRVDIATRYDPTARQVLLLLEDNGPGMPPEIRSRIFEPFFTTKDKGSGTGIGLAMSHRILASHGGAIDCDTAPGRGALFTIRLPAAVPEVADTRQGAAGTGSKAPLHILIVDDEPDVADVIAEMLRSDGHRTEVVNSGQAALTRAAAERFDLVLSDIRMPGLDGPALYARLLESCAGLRGRIGFITGDALSLKARQFLQSTDCPRLEKPVTLVELRALVGRFGSANRPA